jgi:hypothetical protein
MAIHSSVPGQAAPPYGRFPGLGQATIPSGGAPFALGAGTTLHPSAAFSGDAFGISSASERPKKVIFLLMLILINSDNLFFI